MKQYRFDEDINQKIVDGILQGFKNYVDERNEKKKEMKISSAYAWVRGNHIDDQTAIECEEVGIDYIAAKAGYSWGYLRFVARGKRKMFIIKNGRYFDENNYPGRKGVTDKKEDQKTQQKQENYLKQLSQINQKINFPTQPTLFPEHPQQSMTIFDNHTLKMIEGTEVSRLQKDFDHFYVITYETDPFGMISSIKVWLPNPSDEKAHFVDDLTGFIESSSVDLSDIDTTVIEEDQIVFDYDSPAAIDFEIYHKDDTSREDKGGSTS